MTNSTKAGTRQLGGGAQKAIASDSVRVDSRYVEAQYSSPFPKEDNLGRLTKILLTAAGIKRIEVKQHLLSLDEATRPDGLLPALLAGTSGNAWDTDIIKDSSALLGHKVALDEHHDILERVDVIHDNIQGLFRAGAVGGDQYSDLCIDLLVEEGQTQDVGRNGTLPAHLEMQSSNMSVARDAIFSATSQVSLEHTQSTQVQ